MNFISRPHGSLVGNAISLYAVQGLNYLLPLATLPYLLRVLGPSHYGLIVFAQSMMGYAIMVTEFGFNFTATRDISISRNDLSAIRRIYWSTIAAKGFLLLLCAIVLTAVILLVPGFRRSWPIFAASGLLVLGNVVFPQWYLQGLERLKDVAIIQAVAKCIVTGSVFLWVRSARDTGIAAVILSAPQVAGTLAAVMLGKSLAPGWYRPRVEEVIECLRRSWHLFASSISTSLYLHTNTVVLGLVSGEREVALYSVGTRLVAALQGAVTPVTQALFPRASLLFAERRTDAWDLMRRAALLVLPTIAVISACMTWFAPQIVRLIGGAQYSGAVAVLRIMGPVPVCVTTAMLVGQVIMVNTGMSRTLLRIYVSVGVLNLVLLPPLTMHYAARGAAVALLTAEVLGPALMLAAVRRHALGNAGSSTAARC